MAIVDSCKSDCARMTAHHWLTGGTGHGRTIMYDILVFLLLSPQARKHRQSICHSYTFHGCRLRLAYVVTDGGTQNPSITTTRLTRQVEPGTFETYKLVKTSRWTLCFGELVCKLNRTPYVGAALDMLSPCTIWL